MSYRSPFGFIGSDDHNGPDALCLSRTHCVNAAEDTIAEFYLAAVAAIECSAPQPAFFLARQVAELGLKELLSPDSFRTHSLTELLERLGRRGDPLLADSPEEGEIVEFIRDLDLHDARGDQGRYPTTITGALSLATVCCADPTLLRQHLDRLHSYVHGRVTASRIGGAADTPPLGATT
ncbi:hypothetical protein OG800_03160 [Streptomyces sp. NBC_00445]|uniref:hypothetical protein n=1 Tax=Streptomyces sp. NBC_00445 TaxID=2975745 RepID=UPI002E242046